MRSASTHRIQRGKRPGRRVAVSPAERRRLLQLAASLMIFLLAVLGRNMSPQRTEQWLAFLTGDIDLRAALTDFEESTARGEPFLDALGELCVRVVAAEGGSEESLSGNRENGDAAGHLKDSLNRSERFQIWNKYRESQWHIE